MAWFRLHEGTSLDVKWPLIARKANTNVGTVVAVWTAMLDYASQQQVRGTIAGFDCESIDAFYGFEDRVCQSVFDALTAKGMIKDGIITNWEKRQPKKEDENAALRKQQQRERDKAAKTQHVTNTDAQSQPVTQCHDVSRDVTLDKIRIEEIKDIKESSLRSDSFCAEQSCDSSPRDEAQGQPLPLISLPLNNGKLHAVMPDDAEHWQELYPVVDVRQELRNMLGWLEANPKKRKTPTGIKAFITRWLADKQDKGGSPRASPYPAVKQAQPAAPTEFQKNMQERREMASALLAKRQEKKQLENDYAAIDTAARGIAGRTGAGSAALPDEPYEGGNCAAL